jgi:hypothetical protein
MYFAVIFTHPFPLTLAEEGKDPILPLCFGLVNLIQTRVLVLVHFGLDA